MTVSIYILNLLVFKCFAHSDMGNFVKRKTAVCSTQERTAVGW